jgi:hypothetical protein
MPLTDLTFKRYWRHLPPVDDIRVVQAAADETERLLASDRNRERLTSALGQAREKPLDVP